MIDVTISDITRLDAKALNLLAAYLMAQAEAKNNEPVVEYKDSMPSSGMYKSMTPAAQLEPSELYIQQIGRVQRNPDGVDVEAILDAAQGTPLNDQELASVFSADTTTALISGVKIPFDDGVEIEVDSAGVQWDALIHAANKSKLKSGQWRKKPGGSVAIEPQPTAPVAPAPPPIPEINFDSVSTLMNKIIIEDLLTGAQTVAILWRFGVSNLVELSKQPELIEPVYHALQKAIA